MKIFEYGSSFQVLVAMCAVIGSAGALPLGCGGDDATPDPTATGGQAGSGGTSGAGGTGAGTSGAGGTSSGDMCGGIAARVCPNPEGQFCDYDDTASCGISDGSGVCRDRPTACTKECTTVCGCDGKIYCNACEANRAGTDVQAVVKCPEGGLLR